MVTSHELPAA
jgi:hypothetical protein